MIKLEDFLSDGTSIHTIQAVREKVYKLEHDSTPMVWVYDGYDPINEKYKSINEQYKYNNLLCVFRSAYVPRTILAEDLLSKNVVGIYVMLDGIAVCVSDK